MLRTILPTVRLAALRATTTALPATNVSAAASLNRWRAYSAAAGLSRNDIQSRVLDVLKSFEKVDGTQLTPTSSFTTDLGLDSLDAVEVVMAIEEEFAIEIPDEEADAIGSVDQAIDYIEKTPEAH